MSNRRVRPWAVLCAAAALGGSSGCALILGIEERREVEPILVDDETEVQTRSQCIDYCDVVMENCTDKFNVYASRRSCIQTCNALPEGSESEPLGNTVACRLSRAISADGAPDEFCAAAGPGGDGSCGSNCEAWCHLLESECPDDHLVMHDCLTSCEGLPDAGGFDLEASYQQNDIQCRLIHLGAVADDPIHCEHARYNAADQCVEDDDAIPRCERYCDVVAANCAETVVGGQIVDTRIYADRQECMDSCSVFPTGELSDRIQNTVGCRLYHAESSALDPATHCPHASPTGARTCAGNPPAGQTGNCDSYCLLFQAGCPQAFESSFESLDACSTSCVDRFGEEDAALSSYSVGSVTETDSLECRVYFAIQSFDEDVDACEKASLAGRCD